MVCLARRAPECSLRPHPAADVVVRPLNFTVRRQRMTDAHRAEPLIAAGRFEDAFDQLLSELRRAPGSEDLLRIARALSSRVRSRCIDLACNKATDGSREHLALEALLRRIIEVTGEGFYA